PGISILFFAPLFRDLFLFSIKTPANFPIKPRILRSKRYFLPILATKKHRNTNTTNQEKRNIQNHRPKKQPITEQNQQIHQKKQ
ncbi:hypothetical protein, partial [Escherichia coli]|uniref:hypothetical protein n=1 Tax=Escherichia coli TaxID=562 RepID=UPI0023ED8FD5